MSFESQRPFQLTEPLGLWRPLDLLLAGYTLLSLCVLTVGFLKGVPNCGTHILIDGGVLMAMWGVRRWSRDTSALLPTLLRVAYVPMFYWVFYKQIETLWPVFHSNPLDGLLVPWEARLFGGQPSLSFRARFPWPWLSELFCFAYFAYYFFTPVMGLTALFKRGYVAAEGILFTASLCFFGCYTFFWLFPAVGPHFWFPPHVGPQLYDGYVFNHLLFSLTSGGEIHGAAFPSSHVAVALLLTLSARKTLPGLFPVLALVTALMLPAVVYLRAHYLVDVPFGLATGLVFFWLAPKVQRELARAGHRRIFWRRK